MDRSRLDAGGVYCSFASLKSKRIPYLQKRSTAFWDRCRRRLLVEVHPGTVTTSLELP